MNAVEVNNIIKTYDKVKAVDDVSFQVKQGELFGLIGPDGAGKTSLFRILATLLVPDGGSATLDGFDVVNNYKQIRRRVGYMPGRFSLYQDLTVEENLSFFATVFNTSIEENYDLIKDIYVQIEPFRKRRAGKLSGGMKQKLALCCALIHKPSVLLLDEPTTGVDAVSRKEFWEMLERLKAQQITIVVSTPYMDEAKLCDRIALIQNGKIMRVDTADAIVKRFPKPLYAISDRQQYPLQKQLRKDAAVESCYAFGDKLHITLHDDVANTATLKTIATNHGFDKAMVTQINPTIEDSFMRLMQEQQLTTSTSQSTHE